MLLLLLRELRVCDTLALHAAVLHGATASCISARDTGAALCYVTDAHTDAHPHVSQAALILKPHNSLLLDNCCDQVSSP